MTEAPGNLVGAFLGHRDHRENKANQALAHPFFQISQEMGYRRCECFCRVYQLFALIADLSVFKGHLGCTIVFTVQSSCVDLLSASIVRLPSPRRIFSDNSFSIKIMSKIKVKVLMSCTTTGSSAMTVGTRLFLTSKHYVTTHIYESFEGFVGVLFHFNT